MRETFALNLLKLKIFLEFVGELHFTNIKASGTLEH